VAKGCDKITQHGYSNLPPGDEIPNYLLLPIGKLEKKYDIKSILMMIYSFTSSGVGSSVGFEDDSADGHEVVPIA